MGHLLRFRVWNLVSLNYSIVKANMRAQAHCTPSSTFVEMMLILYDVFSYDSWIYFVVVFFLNSSANHKPQLLEVVHIVHVAF